MGTSTGPVALVGSGEFLSHMEAVDLFLLEGRPKKVAVIPTAAALEGTERLSYWLDLAHRHYDALGVETVDVTVIDRQDADSPDLAHLVGDVGLIYLSGEIPTISPPRCSRPLCGRRCSTGGEPEPPWRDARPAPWRSRRVPPRGCGPHRRRAGLTATALMRVRTSRQPRTSVSAWPTASASSTPSPSSLTMTR